MKKFWMMTIAIVACLSAGLQIGCPDGDDDPDLCGNDYCGEAEYASGSCPEDCGNGFCGDGICEEFLAGGRETCATCPSDCHTGCGSDADADSDAETDTTEDGTTDESTSCPNIAGDWDLTYRNSETGMESHETLTLTQDGCLIVGMDEYCEWSGTISESGYISVFVDCSVNDQTVTGTFQTPPHMEGEYYNTAAGSGTWWADPQ